MRQDSKTDVLVVGAGPVGMTTALLLARAGVETTVIEERSTTAARSYACGLHPHSIELFHQLGLGAEILKLGHRVETIAFYDGPTRRAELKLADLQTRFPFVVVLPQNELEELLVRAVRREPRVKLNWHHRLSHLQSNADGLVATVDKLGGTAVGYIIPHWEVIVQSTGQISAQFLVGADGNGSLVRRCLGIDYERVGEPELFAVFEFATDAPPLSEVRVVLDECSTNVLWPLPGGRCRWSFQMGHAESSEEFPHKDRRAIRFEDPAADRVIHERFQSFISQRAPWFQSKVTEFHWVSRVQFERRLAKQFGDGGCWLVGDAAHQTSPVGMQSLNVGLREAEELVADVAGLVKAGAPAMAAKNWNYYEGSDYPAPEQVTTAIESFASWNNRCRGHWLQLFGLDKPQRSAQEAGSACERLERIVPCLPASGHELDSCLDQLELKR